MNSTALSELRKRDDQRAAEVVLISDPLVIAADMKPRKFRTKWQRAVYDGPTAREDAELAERDRWVQLLANLLRSKDRHGRLICENPSNVQLLGRPSCRNAQVKSRDDPKVYWMIHCRARD